MTDLEELARRAVASAKWRWMPGMRWWTDDDHGRLDDFQPEYMGRPINSLPDLTDPATLGCLLALVREVWGEPHMSLECRFVTHYGKWEWTVLALDKPKIIPVYAWSEAEALVAALEAAP